MTASLRGAEEFVADLVGGRGGADVPLALHHMGIAARCQFSPGCVILAMGLHHPHQCPPIEGGEDNSVHVLRDKSFHNLHLLFAVVLSQRAFPEYRDIDAVCSEILAGFHRARMDAFPEFVSGALRNNRYFEIATLRGLFW